MYDMIDKLHTWVFIKKKPEQEAEKKKRNKEKWCKKNPNLIRKMNIFRTINVI